MLRQGARKGAGRVVSTPPDEVSTRRDGIEQTSTYPTRHERPLLGTPEQRTRRDGTPRLTRVNLPTVLAKDYTIVEQLGAGGEGYALLVEDLNHVRYVAKLYLPGVRFDSRVMRLLAASNKEHVVCLHDSGVDDAGDGSRWEVLEWCEHGSLHDLIRSGHKVEVLQVVREVSTALEHIHGLRLDDDNDARLVHQDVKPENILVRRLEPLDLVLGDFGLARLIEGSRHLTQRQEGSRAYAPPSGEAISPGWDWWSLGILAVMLASGRHPFIVDDQYLSDAAISDLLSQDAVDVSGVEDPRLQLLCRGLLTRRTADRWGAAEVNAWLAGASPKVATDTGTLAGPRQQVLFCGKEYSELTELAAAFQLNWEEAQQRVAQRTDQALIADLRTLMRQCGLEEHLELLDDPRMSPPAVMAKLLVALDPRLPPIYIGHDIRPAAILQRLADPQAAPDEVERIRAGGSGYLATGILGIWRSLEGMSEAPRMQDQLDQASRFIDTQSGVFERVPPGSRDLITAQVLASAGADLTHLRRAMEAVDGTNASRQQWWAQLASQMESRPALALAAATASIAAEASRAGDREIEERRAADQRRADDEKRARQRAEEEQGRLALQRTIADRWRGDRRLLKWFLVLVLTGVPALGVGYFVLKARLSGDSLESDLAALAEASLRSVAAAMWAAGAAVLAMLFGFVFVVKGRWSTRRRGMVLGLVFLAIGGSLYFMQDRVEDALLGSARDTFHFDPVPKSRIDGLCSGSTVWTGTRQPTRTAVAGASCSTITSYWGWYEQWSVQAPGDRISELVSMDGVYIARTEAGSDSWLLAVDGSSGTELWRLQCPNGTWDLDTSQQDAGEDTPASQSLWADCLGFSGWLDPRTGENE